MKGLLNHLLRQNWETILKKSLKNCHVRGLHSIMLIDSPGQTVRLYIAGRDHEMAGDNLALHPHHCNLTLEVVRGKINNIIYRTGRGDGYTRGKWLYQSQITTGKMGFTLIDAADRSLCLDSSKHLRHGDVIGMNASTIHTVKVDEGQVAAWFVYEGMEDTNYEPYCWANKDLSKFDTTGLYQKFQSMEEIRDLLQMISII